MVNADGGIKVSASNRLQSPICKALDAHVLLLVMIASACGALDARCSKSCTTAPPDGGRKHDGPSTAFKTKTRGKLSVIRCSVKELLLLSKVRECGQIFGAPGSRNIVISE